MAAQGDLRRFNVEATFRDELTARRAIEELERHRLGVSTTLGEPQDRRAALRGEMRDELESSTVGPGNVGPFTKGMAKGIVIGVPTATLIGLVLGLIAGLFPWGRTLDVWARLVIGGIIGAVAGATAGFVVGGGFKPRQEREGERLESEAGVTVGVHGDDEASVERASSILQRHAPLRVDRVGPDGRPIGPSTKDAMKPVRGETPATPPQAGGEYPRQTPRSQAGGS